MAPLLAEVQLALNERSADQVADQIERTLSQSGSESSRAFGTTFNRHMADVGDEAAKSIQNALRGSVDEAVRGVSSQFGAMGGVAQSALSGISTGAAAATLGVAALVIGVVKVGEALYDVGARWDGLADTISVQTGRMGDDLDQLMSTVKDVGATTAASFETIGDIVGQLSQSMPGLSGNSSAMREMASNLAYLAENGQKVDIRDLGRSMKAFGVESNDASAALDDLYTASARTGVPMNELLKNLVSVGPAARTLGLDFEDTTGLLVNFETAGLDASGAAMALNSAAKVFADSNIPLQTGLKDTVTQIRMFIDAGKDAAAVDLAGKVFGERGAERFVDLIRQGKLNLDDLKDSLGDTGNKIGDLKDSTEDWSEQWTILKNRVSELAEIAGGPLFNALNNALGGLNALLAPPQSPYSGGSNTYPGQQAVPVTPSPGGGIAPPPTSAIQGNGTFLDTILGTNAGTPAPPGLLPKQPLGGRDQDIAGALADAQKSGSKPKLPDAPVVPRAGLPALMPGLQLTSGLLGAQQAVADAETKVAETKARVLQLDGTNVATEQDRLEARNALAKANEDKAQADLRFSEAQQSALKSQTKALDDTSKKLGALGAQLDADFGASGGLPGILENATKALANLGFAPVLGALRGVQVANGYDQNELGGGILGALGASGAFGPQFVKGSQDQQYGALSSGAGSAATSLTSLAQAAMMATGALGGGGSSGGAGPASWWGGASSSGAPSEAQVKAIAAQFGLQVTSEDRPGDPGYHGKGMALDVSNGSGNTPQMRAFADYMAQNFGSSLKELIYSDGPFSGLIGDGQNVTGSGYYSAGTLAEHRNHVHIAAQWGQGGSVAGSPSGRPRGISFPWDAVAQAESSGNWQNNDTGNNGHYGGLQFSPSTWKAYGGNEFAAMPNLATREQQIEIANRTAFSGYRGLNPQGLGAWEVITKGMAPGVTTTTQPTYGGAGGGTGAGIGPGMGGPPQGLLSALGIGAPGLGIPTGPSILGVGGADPSQSVAGGRSFGQGVPASGGVGIGGGGLLGMLGSAAQSGIGLAASGAAMGMDGGAGGAVASAMAGIGIQEIQRAISAGGQYVGALAGGLLETFSLNDSALADPGKSWLGRIAIAAAGARPALPNSAGEMGGKENKNMAEGGKKPPGPMTAQQAKAGKNGQPGADGGNGSAVGTGRGDTFNLAVTNNNNNTRFDPTHNDMQNLMSASAASRQPR